MTDTEKVLIIREQEQAKERTLNFHARMFTVRTVSAYAISGVFAIVGAVLIIFAPESRETAANLIAGAFIVLALGIAGYSRFGVKAPGIDISGERKGEYPN